MCAGLHQLPWVLHELPRVLQEIGDLHLNGLFSSHRYRTSPSTPMFISEDSMALVTHKIPGFVQEFYELS